MKEDKSVHWSRQKEQASSYWHLKFTLILFRFLPVIILRIIAIPIGFFYFLFSKKGRTESRRFLTRAAPFIDNADKAKKCRSPLGPLRHIVSFSLTLVEKLETWGGKYPFKKIHFQDDDIGELKERLENGKGAFVITSHLGNTELLRGLVSFDKTGVSRKVPVTAIIDMKVSKHFSRMLKELNLQSSLDIIGADEIGIHTAAILEEKLAGGEIVTIAGDRTSANNNEKSLLIPFLGEEALFSPGNFYLAALMNAPVFIIFALRRGELSIKSEYNMHVHKCSLPFANSKKERLLQTSELARSFAMFLETYCKQEPFQWYNFFDFWSKEVQT